MSNRQIRKQDERKFLLMALLTLVVGGGGLIALIYGPMGLVTSLPCLLGGAALILVPWGLLTAVERWRERAEQAEMEAIRTNSTNE